MTELKEIYKCRICGNIVEVVHAGLGQLVCCGLPMELQEVKTEDSGYEKHLPVIEKNGKGIKVKIGSVPHPMEPEHYIEWVEVSAGEGACRKLLNPGEKPEADFEIIGKIITARAYCNVHGLWKKG